MGSTKLSPEPQERSSQVELLIISSVFGTVLLVNCVLMRINRTSICTIPLPYRFDVGTLGN